MKKILIIIASVLILLLLGFIFFSRNDAPQDETPLGGLPFGSGEDINIPALTNNTVGEVTLFDENVAAETPIFRLSNTLVAGFTILTQGAQTLVRFVDRATGHIFDVALPKTGEVASLNEMKVTNNTLPKIYEAYFRADGNAVLLRSLEGANDTVRNMALTLTPPRATSSGELYGVTATNLRWDMDSIVVGAGNTLNYVLKNNSSVISSDFSGGSQRVLFSSNFNNWRLGKLGTNLLLYTKASSQAPGFAYSLPVAGGNLTKLIGPLNGLTAVANANGTRLLYSYVENGVTKLFVRNLRGGASSEILPATLAEKCVWSSKEINTFYCGTPLTGLVGAQPDNWYLGRSHFTDYIWRFDTNSETAELVAQPKTDFGLDLDVYEPKLSPNEDFLLFMNKSDMTLWAVRL